MASTIKVDNVQNQPGTNIIDKCGTTITLGQSGDTVSLASGASQTGFGREGSVDWQTGSIKTATFTATSGEGYFCNTSGGAFTVNLPAGSAGAIVAVSDYTRTFADNTCTVAPNGSEKIGGIAENALLTVNGQSATFVYVDGTEGWINVQETQTSQTGMPEFIVASVSGACNTLTTSGDCKIATFVGPGTFTVCNAAALCGATRNVVSYLVVAGGGAGGSDYSATSGGGGGAGGYRELKSPLNPYTASPLDGYPTPANRITVTAQGYPITVGAGATTLPSGPGPETYSSGFPSTFDSITSTGGGGGASNRCSAPAPSRAAGTGGSGGAASYYGPGVGAAGNTPPTTPSQGFAGGNGGPGCGAYGSGGGGGATAVGANGTTTCGGDGGAGATTSINTTPTARAGGGGGAGWHGGPPTSAGAGGPGGGGAGGADGGNPGNAATINTGGGGGGAAGGPGAGYVGGNGGSGIVIIRYKFQ